MIRQLSIRKKLVFYSYMIITPILLIISALLFVKNYREVVQLENETYMQSTQSLSDNIAGYQRGMMELGTYICINNDIRQILTEENPQELNQDTRLWLHNAPMEIIQDMAAINGQIKTVGLYPENGVSPYLRCFDTTSYLIDLEEVRESPVYESAINAKGKVVWYRTGKKEKNVYESSRSEKIVMCREIYGESKDQKLGYLVIGASMEQIQNICEKAIGSSEEGIVVISEQGQQLFATGNTSDETVEKCMQQIQDAKHGNREQSSIVVESDQRYQIYCVKNASTGIYVYRIIPKRGLKDQLYTIAYTPAILLLGFLVGLYPILIIVSNIVSKPLKKLCVAMEKFKKGDFDQKVQVETKDEVGEVAACFNQMVDDMKLLIDNNYIMALKEKESELNALQAQINPHFLYNTLDSLYWQVTDAGNEKIAEDILALSQLFRMVLGQGTGVVTVASEQEMIECYLHIQKMRFSKRMDYSVEMAPEIQDVEIPKLILQPFVENAIVHGIENAKECCKVYVGGSRKKDKIVFCIQDTGVGMTKEQVEAIWNVEDTKRYASQRVGRYAIKNVKERLELKYHEKFSLNIESQKGKGTKVTIEIPYEE